MLGINGGRCVEFFKVSDVLSLKINPRNTVDMNAQER